MEPISSFSGLSSGIQWRDMIDQIMRMETARRIDPIQRQISAQQPRADAWRSFQGLVSKLSGAARGFKDGTAFNVLKASASATASGLQLVSATATSSATPGDYKVDVLAVARADKLRSSEQASATDPLGLQGEFVLNGRAINVTTTDSLNAIRDKINAANSGSSKTGVTATIISTSATAHGLVLTSDATGSRGIELVDSTSNVLQSLGVLNGVQSANTAAGGTGTETMRFSSTDSSIASMLGISTSPPQTTILVGGTKIAVDLTKDTLISIRNKIWTATGSESSARLVQETVGGRTTQRLAVSGSVTADSSLGTDAERADSQRAVELLGFTREGRSNSLTLGSDAKVSIDGFEFTRRSNIITDALPGVTLDLLANDAVLRSAAVVGDGLSLQKDPRTIAQGTYGVRIQSSIARATTGLAILKDPGITGGPFDVALSTTSTTKRTTSSPSPYLSVLNAPTTTLAGTYTLHGITTTTRDATATANLLVTDSALGSAVAGTYDVNVTAQATVASVTGSGFSGTYTKLGVPPDDRDPFTVSDGTNTATVSLVNGDSLATIVSKLNTEFSNTGVKVRAEDSGGQLRLVSTAAAGSSSQIVITANSNTTSQLGSALSGTKSGTDIQGSLVKNGVTYTATGNGSVLTGSSGDAQGLKVEVLNGATGLVGSVTLTDTTTLTGGKFVKGGVEHAATWDASAKVFRGASGTDADGLEVYYTGGPVNGAIGDVTITDETTTVISGGTIGGHAGVWDQETKTLTAASGTPLAGFQVRWDGAVQSGVVGQVHTDAAPWIISATIQGEEAVWDATEKVIRGATGTTFEGLELGYTGPVTTGKVGDLVITGEGGVTVSVTRDLDAAVKAVQSFATAYNEIGSFLQKQRLPGAPLANDSALRGMASSITQSLFAPITGLRVGTSYSRPSSAGVEITRSGTLEVNADTLKKAMETNLDDVRALFSGYGSNVFDTTDKLAKPGTGNIAQHMDTFSRSTEELTRRMDAAQTRLEIRRAAMVKQFTEMERVMARAQQQSAWLGQQIRAMQPSGQ